MVVAVTVAMVVAPGPAAAQGPEDGPALRASLFGGASLREDAAGILGDRTLRVGQDVLSVAARLTWPRRGIQPWVQLERFVRPDFECLPGIVCNTEGLTALAGVVLPLTRDDTQPGIHTYLLGGLGAGFAAEDVFAYTLGVGTSLTIFPWVAPSFEVRWEDLPGIQNVVMLNLGVRADLF